MLGDTLRQLDAALKMLESAQSIERIKTGRMRLFELLFDQDIGVNTSAAQWHHRTLYTQKWSRPQLPFFLLEAVDSGKHNNSVRLCWSFGAELNPKERNELLKCHHRCAALWLPPGG